MMQAWVWRAWGWLYGTHKKEEEEEEEGIAPLSHNTLPQRPREITPTKPLGRETKPAHGPHQKQNKKGNGGAHGGVWVHGWWWAGRGSGAR